MANPLLPGLNVHEDSVLFREALNYTAARTGFIARLIEKDYFCTVLLAHLTAVDPRLVFKGGTCLAKVHCGFFRLSEDLDFAISLPVTASRKERRRQAKATKAAVASIPATVPVFRLAAPLIGANDSAQYNGALAYRSLLAGTDEIIKVEISLREPVLLKVDPCPTNTLLLDAINREPLVPPIGIPCIAYAEAMAEKFRAALTRREVAVRDFFDLDHAINSLGLDPDARALIDLVRQKVTIPDSEPVIVSDERLLQLRAQLESRLRPVLRKVDFDQFNLNRAFAAAQRMAGRIV
jgi:predicted nucleotidyltransferase component of viral defense system